MERVQSRGQSRAPLLYHLLQCWCVANCDAVTRQIHVQASIRLLNKGEGACHRLVEGSLAPGLLRFTALSLPHRMSGECQSAVSICKYCLLPAVATCLPRFGVRFPVPVLLD